MNKLLKVFGIGVLAASIAIGAVGCVDKKEVKQQPQPVEQQQLEDDTDCCG